MLSIHLFYHPFIHDNKAVYYNNSTRNVRIKNLCAGVSCIAKSQATEAAGSSLDAMSSPTKTKLTFLSVWMTRGHFSKYSRFFFPIGGHNLHQCHPFLSGKGHHSEKIQKISFNYQIFRMHRFLKHILHVGIQI